jgi:hypothetical protein
LSAEPSDAVASNLDVIDVPEEVSDRGGKRYVWPRTRAGKRCGRRGSGYDHLVVERSVTKPFNGHVVSKEYLVRLVRRVRGHSSGALESDGFDFPWEVDRAVDAEESAS